MPRPIRLPRPRPVGLALVAAASVMLLSGCVPESPAATETAAPPSGSATPAPSGEPTESPAPTEEPTPFAIACDALVTNEQMYQFNPNFGNDPGYSPSAAGVVAVVDGAGTACGWINQTSGDVIEIGVATLPPTALEQRKNEAALGSNVVPTYGTPPEIEGYFRQVAGNGEAQVFRGTYWIVIDSVALFEPGDAQQLVTAVLGNLPAV